MPVVCIHIPLRCGAQDSASKTESSKQESSAPVAPKAKAGGPGTRPSICTWTRSPLPYPHPNFYHISMQIFISDNVCEQ